MKTNDGRRAIVGPLCGPLFGVGVALALMAPLKSKAVIPVIIDADLSFIANELPHWRYVEWQNDQQTKLLQQQVTLTKEFLDRLGDAGKSVSKAAASVSSVSKPIEAILAMESCDKTVDAGMGAKLPAKSASMILADTKVSSSFKVMGESEGRTDERYRGFAVQDRMRERYAAALEQQNKVAETELSLQKSLFRDLGDAKTQIDVQVIHAALTASQQRLELARMKCEQARDECGTVDRRLLVEKERRREADVELGEAMARKLKARALSSLSAQASDSLY